MKKISISLIFLISFFGLRPCSIFSAPSNIQEVYEIKLNKKEKRLIKVFSDQAINKSVKKAEKNKFDPFFIIDPLGKIFIAPLVKVAKISRVIPIPERIKRKIGNDKNHLNRSYYLAMKKYTKFIQRALTFSFKKISFTKVVQFLQSSSTLESTINWGVNVAIKLGRKLIDDKNQLKIILKTQQTAIELEKNYGVKRKQTYFWLSATSKILKSIIKCLYLKKDDNGFCVFSPTRRLIIELFKDHEAGLVYQEYLKGNIDKEILSHTVYEDKDLVRGLVLRIPELQQYVYWMKNPTL